MSDYLTTKELAALLRIKERKVYDLAASGAVPCTKATGKLLFPREGIEAWLANHSTQPDGQSNTPRPNVIVGSHDPLLDWAIRESQCAIATYYDGSQDGLTRFAAHDGIATGIHLYDANSQNWNTKDLVGTNAARSAVLIAWATRQRGLIVHPDHHHIRAATDLVGHRVVPRQTGAGAQALFVHILNQAGIQTSELDLIAPARTEADAAVAVLEGKAHAAFGLAALATQYNLPFIPVMDERFDLLIDRRHWFEHPLRKLFAFCRSPAFLKRAQDLTGYDVSELGYVRWNGP